MKSKEKDIAKTICNEIFSSIGKLLVNGAEEAFVSGEYEIYKSGKQAGLYEAKKAVKRVLEGYLREESVKKVYGSDLKAEEPENLYSELVVIDRDYGAIAPKPFIDWLKDNGYSLISDHAYLKKLTESLNIYVSLYENNFSVISYHNGYKSFYSDNKDTTLTDFKKILEEAENYTPPNEVEKEKLYSELACESKTPKPFTDWLKDNCYYSKDGAVFVQKHITLLIVYVNFYKYNFSVIAYYEGRLVFDCGYKNTTLTEFKKILEQVESYTPLTNGEK